MEATLHPPTEKENGLRGQCANFFSWCRANPLQALLLAAVAGTLVFFFGFIRIFVNGSETAAQWAWLSWNAESEQDYCMIVPPISLWLFWNAREKLRAAPKRGDSRGLVFLGIGVLLFAASARVLEARLAMLAVPFILFGATFFLWGRHVARIIFFPCAFLFFMLPLGALEPMTARLQGSVTWMVGFIGNVVGLNIQSVGTTIMAADRSFNFQVAEGCSGIRSITALTMLTAVYVHLTEMAMWKKVTTFAASLLFAIIGNAGRIFTIIVVARLFNANLAGGKYHHISGFISFPFALAAMLAFSKLLDLNWKKLTAQQSKGVVQREGTKYDY